MAKNDVVRLGLIQHACSANPKQNLDRAVELIREAARRGAQIVVTQELFSLPYFPATEDVRHFELAEPIPGPTYRRLSDLAAELGVFMVASLFEKRAVGIYHNTAVMIDGTADRAEASSGGASGGASGGGRYRKMHIPDDPGFYEKFYFTPGDAPAPGGLEDCWAIQQTPYATTGVLICWDQWFPEAARLMALRGAQILLYPTAIAWSRDTTPVEQRRQFEAWQTVQRGHAIANGVFVAAINRVGVEQDLRFWGRSFVADPSGQIIAEADASKEQVLVADCDLACIAKWRHDWPFLRDRRVDAYGGLLERYLGNGPLESRL